MLKELRVRNYKSLEDVAIPLRPLTVFVGPNNAGKSNILDCLLFLRELLELGAPSVHSRGGFRYLVWGGDLKRQIKFELDAYILDVSSREHSINYRIEIAGGPGHYVISKETCSVRINSEERKLLEFPVEQGRIGVWDESAERIVYWGSSEAGRQLCLSNCKDSARYPILSALAKELLEAQRRPLAS
jgi:predicted ATPase